MKLFVDNKIYSAIGPVFTVKIIKDIARAMQTAGLELDPTNPSEQHMELIYNICFNVFARIEGPNQIPIDETDYFAHLAFSTDRGVPDAALIATDRTILHGKVLTDELIKDALSSLEVTARIR